jgi:uncharacterized paraquat-inducible protein A
LRGCPRCGLVHQVPQVPAGHLARCSRCGDVIRRSAASRANQICAAVAVAALICYPLGITLPVMKLQELGHVREASIWSGTVSLMEHGQWLIGLIVLTCSIIIPVLKLIGLFLLCSRPAWLGRHHKAGLYRAIEAAGRWGMIDVLLVALVVAAVKLGDMVTVSPGPGTIAFTACVMLSLVASTLFDPHAIWEEAAND